MGSRKALLWCVVTVALCVYPHRVRGDCTKLGPCSCQAPDGVIDLSPLDGNSEPTFKDQPASSGDGWQYSWNPCSPFTETDPCTGVSGCQISSDQSQAFPIGFQDSADFVTDSASDGLYLDYSANDGSGGVRYLIVELVCDTTADPGSLTVVGEVQQSSYLMVLNSVHCCPKSNPSPSAGGGGGGLSVGSVLVIGFFGLVVVYALGGVVTQKYVRKASGKEVVPNYGLWSALPGLIKDGVLFTFSCGKRGGYDKL